ncbi:ABC-F family ATP-binding cassette domain-containing protein [Candidatus Deianiraea vastatrix]|uniref:ABC transporter ATP-binding protein domain protein n=1 Tax=Candidatus Deianiraea vastatrix TaxID=2163644 RepID=A0A5B8XC90_9RICK|nr:ABC-F family ATP-binding cassette domain-containing protein [Candidatus Deianiraea vastatrix]QED22880.1 Putative ABC transporter ATP-binding protein domain protein [Candidatus Deianiraea vastatrix]
MINIRELSIEFNGRCIFEDVNFSINPGEKIGLIGRNGTGKTTFLKLLLKKLEPSSGKIEIPDYYRVGYLEQHFDFTHPTAAEEVYSVLPPERESEAWKGDMILMGLGFSGEQMFQDPKELSGGYQVKVNLAKMLLMESELLILDEPTNYLDIYSIRWLADFLKKWEGELILITHDRNFMDKVITHTLIIHRNNFRKIQGKPQKIKEQIKQEEEIYEKTRLAEEKERKELEDWIRRFGATASKASQVQSRIKMLEKKEVRKKLDNIQDLDFKFSFTPYDTKDDVIQVKNLTFGFEESKDLITNLSFEVKKGDKICIIGRNGQGKSTLLQLIGGILTPKEGEISINEKAKYGYFGQTNVERLNPDLAIWEELQESSPESDYGTVRRICAYMLFPGQLAEKKIGVLSGGEKSRVMLGKILLNKVNLLMLDEPTNHFDMESSEALLDAIKEFEGAVLMVTHDEEYLFEVANKLIVFDGGKTFLFHGGYKEFLKEIGWKE